MSISQSGEGHMLDVATSWNSSVNKTRWTIDLEDVMDLLDITNEIVASTSHAFGRDMILDWDWSGTEILRESEVDFP